MIKLYNQNEYWSDLKFEAFNFPAGERHVRLDLTIPFWSHKFYVEYFFDGNESIIELLLVCDALKRSGFKPTKLLMPYVPFSPQDRVMVPGEPLSIKVFCDLINSIGFGEVVITDPHSDVTPALLNNCTIEYQHEVFQDTFDSEFNGAWLVAPDGGSLKKINKMAAVVNNTAGIVHCEKIRNVKTGEITGTVVHKEDFEGKDAVILDDICFGGKTHIEIAKILKQRNCGKIVLMVTHGFFTKGLEVFNDIDHIFSRNGKQK